MAETDSKSGVDIMVERAREVPATFVNKIMIEGLGPVVKITLGEAALMPDQVAAGLTPESVFRPRVAVAMAVGDAIDFHRILTSMLTDIGALNNADGASDASV